MKMQLQFPHTLVNLRDKASDIILLGYIYSAKIGK